MVALVAVFRRRPTMHVMANQHDRRMVQGSHSHPDICHRWIWSPVVLMAQI